MKKELNNIVVYNEKNPLIGSEIIKIFKKLGIDTDAEGCSIYFPYYGIINDCFSCYTIDQVLELKAKIITLEQLKAMKEDNSEYPKLMYVGNVLNDLNIEQRQRIVICKQESGYWAEDDRIAGMAHLWKYAQDIEEEKPEIEKTISVIIDGVEYVPKSNNNQN